MAIAAALASPSPPAHCAKTFTVPMVKRAVDVAYGGTRLPSRFERRRIGRFVRCRRNRSTGRALHAYWHDAIVDQAARRDPPLNGPVVASWFADAGATACGTHYRYGFASLFLACGAQVVMRGPGGTVTATMEDRGPFVSGRTFDLSAGLEARLGCGDLCAVRWRLR